MNLSKPIDRENELNYNVGCLISVDESEFVQRIKDIQAVYESVFNRLRWHLRYVYALNYESIFGASNIDTDALEYFISDIDSEVERMLAKHRLTKTKTYGTGIFTVQPTELDVSEDMSLREFTELNFLTKVNDSTFAHVLSYMEADEISLQLATLSYDGVMSNDEIEQEFLSLEEFIEDVRDLLKVFISFRAELRELNDELFEEYVGSCGR